MSIQSLEAAEVAYTSSLLVKIRRSLQRRGVVGTLKLIAWKIGDPLGNWLLPSRWRARRLDYEFDAKFGVDTRGIVALNGLTIHSENVAHAVRYEQTKPADFATLIKYLRLKFEDFIFVDFGAGKGRVLLLASDYPFRKIIGVEFACELLDAARQNLRIYRSERQQCRDFELHCLDAVQYQVPPENAVFYFYNPFDEVVMKEVLTNISQSLLEHPREAFILYCNSRCRDLLPQFGFSEIGASYWYAVYRFENGTNGEKKIK